MKADTKRSYTWDTDNKNTGLILREVNDKLKGVEMWIEGAGGRQYLTLKYLEDVRILADMLAEVANFISEHPEPTNGLGGSDNELH